MKGPVSSSSTAQQLNSVVYLKTFMWNINHNNSAFPALNINSKSMFENLLKLFSLAATALSFTVFSLQLRGGKEHGATQVHNSVLLKWEAD